MEQEANGYFRIDKESKTWFSVEQFSEIQNSMLFSKSYGMKRAFSRGEYTGVDEKNLCRKSGSTAPISAEFQPRIVHTR